ncbi:MAG: serine/threonine protein kinase [Holophagales bacterium]|nr:serine/threonine protein kinase [Holophagales bacterium]
MTLVAGSRLGPYEINSPLGEGGMGIVYRATDSKLKREVAIKVLPEAFAEDADRLARFEREAQVLAQLQHPGIASIYGLEESSGVRALVMELVEGEDLAERMKRGSVALEEAISIARQIAEALEAAHDKGIVHRDLKPANVKLTPEGTVKVLDFGLAKAMDPPAGSASAADLARSPTLMNSPTMTAAHGTQLGVILGTAAYMAPEQARGSAVDKRADIWALGVVLYEMLTGRSLFAADTVSDTLAGVLRGEIDLAKLPAGTPPALRRLLRRCLERNPKNRLHDAADARLVLADLEAGVADEGADAPPDARPQPEARGRRLGPRRGRGARGGRPLHRTGRGRARRPARHPRHAAAPGRSLDRAGR